MAFTNLLFKPKNTKGAIKVNQQVADVIVEFIKKNRISTTEVADALGKKGAIEGLYPVNQGKHRVGRVHGVVAVNGSNYFVHKEISKVMEGDVFLISTVGFSTESVIGDLIARSVLLYSSAAAIIVEGNVRDYARLIREDYAIWCKGRSPIGAINTLQGENQKSPYEGGVAVCDDGGVVVIPKEQLNNEFLEKLIGIEQQEDIWYFCLNTLKWSTFDIVCLRRYEENPSDLPSILQKGLRFVQQ